MNTSAHSLLAFRHAIMRDAAYQLHLPSSAGLLHELALEVLEGQVVHGNAGNDISAEELAYHAGRAARTTRQLSSERRAILLGKEHAYLRQAAEMNDTSGNWSHAGLLFEKLASHSSTAPEKIADDLRCAAMMYSQSGRHGKAVELVDLSLSAVSSADVGQIARILDVKATVLWNTGKREDALACYHDALEHATRAGNGSDQGTILGNISRCHIECGRFAAGLEFAERAINLNERHAQTRQLHGNRSRRLQALQKLNPELVTLAEWEQLLREALESGVRTHIGHAHNNLGIALCESGAYAKASEEFAAALETFANLGHALFVAKALNNLGHVEMRCNRHEKAVQYFNRSLEALGHASKDPFEREVAEGRDEAIRKRDGASTSLL